MLDIYQHRVFSQLKIYWNILFLMLRQVTRDKVYINNGNITEKNWYSILDDVTSIFSTSTDDVSNIAPRVFDMIWLENTVLLHEYIKQIQELFSLLTCYGFNHSSIDTGMISLMPSGSCQYINTYWSHAAPETKVYKDIARHRLTKN